MSAGHSLGANGRPFDPSAGTPFDAPAVSSGDAVDALVRPGKLVSVQLSPQHATEGGRVLAGLITAREPRSGARIDDLVTMAPLAWGRDVTFLLQHVTAVREVRQHTQAQLADACMRQRTRAPHPTASPWPVVTAMTKPGGAT